MSDEIPDEFDLTEQHLRPAPRGAGRRRQQPPPPPPPERIAWEENWRGRPARAFVGSFWRLASSPAAAFAKVPTSGGLRRPWFFALVCGAVFGLFSELTDALALVLLHTGGSEIELSELVQFSIAGRSLAWLPVSILSLAGCLFGLLIGGPLFLAVYSLLLAVWGGLLHLLLKLVGALATSGAGFEGTLRVVFYAQTALAAAVVPWVGDPMMLAWVAALQITGLTRMHGCGRGRAAVAVLLPIAGLIALLVALWLASPPGGSPPG